MEHHGFVVRGVREMENHFECLWDLFRSIPSLEQPHTSVLDEIYWLDKNGINLHIIDMNVPTKNMMVKIFFTMMSAFAELEANLLSERTKKGLEAARTRERKGGRPSLPDHKKREIKFLYDEQKLTGEEIAKQAGVSRSPVYRTLKQTNIDQLK